MYLVRQRCVRRVCGNADASKDDMNCGHGPVAVPTTVEKMTCVTMLELQERITCVSRPNTRRDAKSVYLPVFGWFYFRLGKPGLLLLQPFDRGLDGLSGFCGKRRDVAFRATRTIRGHGHGRHLAFFAGEP